MPKYWVKNYFTHGRFPEVGQKQKTEKKKKKKKRENERKLVITMAKLRMAHASTHGAHKPPGPAMLGTPTMGGAQTNFLPSPMELCGHSRDPLIVPASLGKTLAQHHHSTF